MVHRSSSPDGDFRNHDGSAGDGGGMAMASATITDATGGNF
ncbi:hypothetical protein OK016_19275 [Vibrio chagasii]|nr:hypothetical protein [Vibrio chagasii]